MAAFRSGCSAYSLSIRGSGLPRLARCPLACATVDRTTSEFINAPMPPFDVAAVPGRPRHGPRGDALCGLLIAWLWLMCAPLATAADARNVLMLYSNGRLLPASVEFDRGLYAGLAAHPEVRVDLAAEFLDAPKFSGTAYDKTIATYLRDKYGARPPEVIIVGGEEALTFMLQHRSKVFPDVPVIFQSVPTTSLRKLLPLPDDVIGVPVDVDFPGTVELALRWHGSARRLVLVTGVTKWDRDWEARLRKEVGDFEGRVSVEFLTGLSTEALKQRLGTLESDSVVFTPGFFRDGAGAIVRAA